MMTMRNWQDRYPKQVHFANGFPSKELVPSSRTSPNVNMHGGFFVGLHDEMPSRLTKQNRSIPPLAKGRGQFCAVNQRNAMRLERNETDPFKGHKGAEKTGFTAYPIKHSRPVQTKSSHIKTNEPQEISTSLPNFPRSISSQFSPMTVVIGSALETVTRPTKLVAKSDVRIMTDVEKEATLSELAGIDEVYQRVCHGNRDSLYSLVSPVKSKRTKYTSTSNMQFLQTSSSLVPTVKHKSSNPLKTSLEADDDLEANASTRTVEMFQMPPKQPRVILVPLPYFQKTYPRSPQTAPARNKATYERPHVYGNYRSAKQYTRRAISSHSDWSSPSIINFSPTGLPEVSRPGTRGCDVTGSIIGVQNRSHTGKVAIVASLDKQDVITTPPATAAGTGLYSNQSIDEDYNSDSISDNGMKGKDDGGYVDIDCASPERAEFTDRQKISKTDNESIHMDGLLRDDDTMDAEGGDIQDNGGSHEIDVERGGIDDKYEDGDSHDIDVDGADVPDAAYEIKNGPEDTDRLGEIHDVMSDMQSLSITLNVTTEEGATDDVEIYDATKRDIDKENQVAQEIQEAQENYQKRIREIETLLDEHGEIIKQVHQLEEELHEIQ